jgi:hypothetical protein
MGADPNQPLAAFTEYAADKLWVSSHLTQFAGMALIVAALLILARDLEGPARRAWPRLAAAGAVATLALGGALQAVDGIALKAMVDMWAAARPPEKETIYYAALAVRQVEIGLASIVSLVFGLTALLYGAALFADSRYRKWLSALSFTGGLLTALSGIAMAATGFSEAAMWLNMPGMSILLVWSVSVGLCMWRMDRLG